MDVYSAQFVFALGAALFLGGTPALVSAIYFAVSGELNIWLLLFLSVVTTLVWDTMWYLLGHRFVSFDRIRSWYLYERNQELYEKIFALYGQRQYLLLFFSRFMYGTNSACSVVSGMFRMNFGYFLGVNALSLVGQFGALYALSYGVHSKIATLDVPYAFVFAIVLLIVIVLTVRFAVRSYFNRM